MTQAKAKHYQAVLDQLLAGQIPDKDKVRLCFWSIAGNPVKLSDPRAEELLRERIEAEKAG